MDLGLSIGIGLVILGIGLYSRKWAALVSFFGFIPFWLAGMTGILGIKIDPGAVDQAVRILSGEILVTYLVGVALGWLPHIIKSKIPQKAGKQ
jgi:hypothetical protein